MSVWNELIVMERSKFTGPVRLIRIVFEIRGTPDNEIVHVITAFDED